MALFTLAEQILLHWQSRSYLHSLLFQDSVLHSVFFVGCQVFGFPVLGCMERVCFVFLGVLTAPAAALQLQHLHGHAQQPTEGEDLRAAAPGAGQVVQGPTQQGWHPSELTCGWCSGCEFSYAHKSLILFSIILFDIICRFVLCMFVVCVRVGVRVFRC